MKRIFLFLLVLALSLTLVACANPATNDKPQGSDGYLYLTEESDANLISVQIPVVATANAQAVNACIQEQVYRELQRWLILEESNLTESAAPVTNIGEKISSSEYTAVYLHISGCLSFESEDMISLVFTGEHNAKWAAHPNHVFFSVNVDVPSAQRIGIADICTVDDSLYAAFEQHVTSEWVSNEELLESNVFDKDHFLDGLAREPETEFYSYFTPTHVGISYPVPFALGNHLEAEIPRAEVNFLSEEASK